MDQFARFTITNSRFTILLLVGIVIAGLLTFQSQPRQEDPEITLRGAQVVAQFPGLSPERVEQLLTKPIEEVIKQMLEIDTIKSVSMAGLAIISPEVAPQYLELDPIWADLRNKMDDLASSLPQGTVGPMVNDDFGRVAVVTLALYGDDYTMAELAEVSRDLRDQLGALPLVAKVGLYGQQDERIWMEVNPALLL